MQGEEDQGRQPVYRIKIRGLLDPFWSEWFDGMAIAPQANGDTVLSGPVRDQAALHGLLVKIRDMGMSLLLVEQLEASSGDGEG